MHIPRPPRLYSPLNFFLGCQLTFFSRAAVSHIDALHELAPSARGAFGKVATLLFALLAGVALLLAVVRGVGHGAPAVMQTAAPVVSAYGLALFVALVVFGCFSWLLARAGRSVTRFYAGMCQVGHAHRCEVAGRSPTLRCYTSKD